MSDKKIRALTFATSIIVGGVAIAFHLMPVFVAALVIAIFCQLPIWK